MCGSAAASRSSSFPPISRAIRWHSSVRYERAAAFWPQYLRGQAYLRLKNAAEAAAEFQRILDHPGEAPLSPLYPLAHLPLARAAMLQGDVATARKSYDSFLTLWQKADADVPILTEVKREYATLH
jgi:outer membrane protein assembly factor BamD (BamD/ComL family)